MRLRIKKFNLLITALVLVIFLLLLQRSGLVLESRKASQVFLDSTVSNADTIFQGREVVSVSIDGVLVDAVVSRTPDEMRRGLSGVTGLEVDQGMLFVFPVATQTSFWMKDMLIPLDFIWITGERVVDISQNIQPPSSITDASKLPLITPQVPVNYVLEVNAGFVSRHGIRRGDRVSIEFE